MGLVEVGWGRGEGGRTGLEAIGTSCDGCESGESSHSDSYFEEKMVVRSKKHPRLESSIYKASVRSSLVADDDVRSSREKR